MKYRCMAIFAVLLFFVVSTIHPVFAVSLDTAVTAQQEEKGTTVEYPLPYPGVLPDHPLYMVKRFRDFLLEHLIAEPSKKAEFYILQGDKRLEMGRILTEQSKYALAETTISKSEKYMEQAINMVMAVEKNGSVAPKYLVEKLTLSLEKHAEVIDALITSAPNDQRNGLTESLTRTKQVLEQIKKLKTSD